MDDAELIHAIREDNENAFKLFFERHYKPLLVYTVSFTKNTKNAEDIVQQAFITFWSNRKKLDINRSAKSYLFTIARNAYLDEYRKEKRKNIFLDELKENILRDYIESDDDLLDKKIKKLKNIVDGLPEKCKEILKMNKEEGIKYKEIAKLKKISLKTVESHMRNAFQKIREGFEEDNSFFLFVSYNLEHILKSKP